MAVQTTLTRDDRFVRVSWEGVLDGAWVRTVEEAFEEYARECEAAGVSGILIDVRGTTNRMSIMEHYELGTALANSSLKCVRVAALMTPQVMLPDQFASKVATNLGAVQKNFLHEAEAIAWARGEG